MKKETTTQIKDIISNTSTRRRKSPAADNFLKNKKPKRRRSYEKKLKRRRSLPKELFPSFILQNLLGWAHNVGLCLQLLVLDNPLSTLSASILEDLAAYPLVYFISLLWKAHYAFYFGGSCYSSFCIVPENKIMQHNIFLMH